MAVMPVLLGALLALATALLLQAVVVPWVQARTRRRERWEDAVMELVTLLEEQLPRALREFREAAREERHLNGQMREAKDEVAHWLTGKLSTEAEAPLLSAMLQLLSFSPFDPRPGSQATVERRHQAWAERRRAADSVASQIKRVRLLTARVTSLRRQAPTWAWFKIGVFRLSMTTHALTDSMTVSSLQPTEDEWRQMSEDQDKAQSAFMELLEPLALSMRPPAGATNVMAIQGHSQKTDHQGQFSQGSGTNKQRSAGDTYETAWPVNVGRVNPGLGRPWAAGAVTGPSNADRRRPTTPEETAGTPPCERLAWWATDESTCTPDTGWLPVSVTVRAWMATS